MWHAAITLCLGFVELRMHAVKIRCGIILLRIDQIVFRNSSVLVPLNIAKLGYTAIFGQTSPEAGKLLRTLHRLQGIAMIPECNPPSKRRVNDRVHFNKE